MNIKIWTSELYYNQHIVKVCIRSHGKETLECSEDLIDGYESLFNYGRSMKKHNSQENTRGKCLVHT